MAARRKTIAIDFDGTINSYVSGFVAIDEIPDLPVPGAFEFIERAVLVFDRVCIFSTRNTSSRGCAAMVRWFRLHGMREVVIAQLQFPLTKPRASVFIDDRAIKFNGDWSEFDPMKLVDFKPWWK